MRVGTGALVGLRQRRYGTLKATLQDTPDSNNDTVEGSLGTELLPGTGETLGSIFSLTR